MRAVVLCAVCLVLPASAHAASLVQPGPTSSPTAVPDPGAPGAALDDAPPAIAWALPRAGARLAADPLNPLVVTAGDDHGIAMVRFLDDDEVLCEVTAAPYTCGFKANLGDVGRNTLSAVAIDTAGQSTTIQRVVTVSRFKAPLKMTVEPGFRVTGRLETAGDGCRGTVIVRAVVGKRTLARRRLKLDSRCGYEATFKLARPSGLRFRANFGGNALVTARAVTKAAPR